MAELLTTDTELTTVADAIRGKTGGTANLSYPNGFASAIQGIGSYSSGAAGAGDIRSGKKAYVGNGTVTGNMSEKAAATYNVSASDQSIAAGQYLTGAQTIRRVVTVNLTAANIKKGVTVQVGDSGSASRIASITGTCAEANTSMPLSADCFIPFMFKASDTLAVSFYWNGNGFRVHGANAGQRQFIVPRPIRMTYYAEDTSTSTSQVTFTPGNVYTLAPYNNQVAQIWGGGYSVFHVYRITNWEAV